MPVTAYSIVLASTVTHAYWNYVLKRNGGGAVFVGLSKLLEVLIFAPIFVVFALPELRAHSSASVLVVIGAVLSLANYAALGRAYEMGDLSVVYPVSRGAMLLFLPVLGYVTFGERLNAIGWIAIVLVLMGIVLLKMESLDRSGWRRLSAHRRDPAVLFALLAALAAAGYTIWDKHAVQTLAAFTYFYSYTLLVAGCYGAYLYRYRGVAALRTELRAKWWPIAQVAVLNTVTYVLILIALKSGKSSYVIALRQLSIAVGAVLGWRLLGETFDAPQRVGVVLIVGGCIAIALAR